MCRWVPSRLPQKSPREGLFLIGGAQIPGSLGKCVGSKLKGNVTNTAGEFAPFIRPASANLFTYTITKFALNHKWQLYIYYNKICLKSQVASSLKTEKYTVIITTLSISNRVLKQKMFTVKQSESVSLSISNRVLKLNSLFQKPVYCVSLSISNRVLKL